MTDKQHWETLRYDAEELTRALNDGFTLVDSTMEFHATPFGTTQPFLYALFRRTSADTTGDMR